MEDKEPSSDASREKAEMLSILQSIFEKPRKSKKKRESENVTSTSTDPKRDNRSID